MSARVECGDCRELLAAMDKCGVQCCITSPPYYGLRDYGHEGQIGLEASPAKYIDRLVSVFREVRRVLRDDGTLWLNIGDSYAGLGGRGEQKDEMADRAHRKATQSARLCGDGLKPKDLIGIPWRVALALQADGWYLRQDIIWHKPNPMPESVRDRCTKAHEYMFLLSKSERYYFDHEAMKEPATGRNPGNKKTHKYAAAYKTEVGEFNRTKVGLHAVGARETRNRRSVWTVATRPYKGAHFATFPPALVEPCVLTGSRSGDLVIDPFTGSGTTGEVAVQHNRRFVGLELNPEYAAMARSRIDDAMFGHLA